MSVLPEKCPACGAPTRLGHPIPGTLGATWFCGTEGCVNERDTLPSSFLLLSDWEFHEPEGNPLLPLLGDAEWTAWWWTPVRAPWWRRLWEWLTA